MGAWGPGIPEWDVPLERRQPDDALGGAVATWVIAEAVLVERCELCWQWRVVRQHLVDVVVEPFLSRSHVDHLRLQRTPDSGTPLFGHTSTAVDSGTLLHLIRFSLQAVDDGTALSGHLLGCSNRLVALCSP